MNSYKAGEAIPQDEPLAWITGKGGHYLLKRNPVFEACIQADCMPDYAEQKEYFQLRAGKIPVTLFGQALAFMAEVYRKHRSEALVLLTHDEHGWGAFAPKQRVSLASISYSNDRRVVGSIHSHPGMTLRPSGTDEHDEADFDGIHIICNDFLPHPGCIVCFAAVGGQRFRLEPALVIEGLLIEHHEVPAGWLDMVSSQRSESKRERAKDKDKNRDKEPASVLEGSPFDDIPFGNGPYEQVSDDGPAWEEPEALAEELPAGEGRGS